MSIEDKCEICGKSGARKWFGSRDILAHEECLRQMPNEPIDTKGRPAYLWDEKLQKLAKQVGDVLRENEELIENSKEWGITPSYNENKPVPEWLKTLASHFLECYETGAIVNITLVEKTIDNLLQEQRIRNREETKEMVEDKMFCIKHNGAINLDLGPLIKREDILNIINKI